VKVQQTLGDYELPPMDDAVNEALLDFITRRKAEMTDQWY